MRFIVAMAWREIRASWRRLVLFFVCMALGVGAMVSMRSFTRVFEGSIEKDARLLLAADVRVESNDPWTADQRDILERAAALPDVAASSRMFDTDSMVRADGAGAPRPLLATIRGVDGQFPLRGTLRLRSGTGYDFSVLAGRGVIVSESLLERLRVRRGDRILVGGQPFTIRDVMMRLPGSGLNFSPGPRLLMRAADVEALGLTGFGSRVGYRWLFTTADGRERAVAEAIGREFQSRKQRGWISTFHYPANWLTESLSNIDGLLSLIGLSIVVLGGIGVASVTRVFVQQRLRTVAILKCLGGRTWRVLGAYLAQVLILSTAGALIGLGLAAALTGGLAPVVSRRLPLDVEPRLSALACLQGGLVAVLVSLLFALPPLLEIRDVKPILVLRQESVRRLGVDWLKAAAQVLIAAAIAALAGWLAGTLRTAGLLVAGIFVTAVVLHGVAAVLMHGLFRVRRARSFAARQGVRSLYRPGNQTRVTLFTVGLGALFVIAVRLFQVNVQQEYSLDLKNLAADMFFIDVQPADRDRVRSTLESLGAHEVMLLTMARGRLVGLRRNSPHPVPVPGDRFGGEFRLTSKPALDPSETIADGAFWPPTPASSPEVSIEQGYAEWLRVGVGDVLVFEIAGKRVNANVTSVRTYDRRVRTFSALVHNDFLFRPGSLEALPHSYVGAAKGPADAAARAGLQNAFTVAFPGVTFLDALDEIQEIRMRVSDVSAAVSAVGGFVLASGILILVGSVAMTRTHRLYESAIFRTLGAKRRVLFKITIVEYGVLGSLAGLVGSAAAVAVTWTMSRFGARPIPWHFHPWINVTGAASTAILVTVVGVLSTIAVTARKPTAVLREP